MMATVDVSRFIGRLIVLSLLTGLARADEATLAPRTKVLLKSPNHAVKDADQVIPLKRYLTFYTVERVEGDRVRLSTGGRECYAQASDLIPIDQAIAYFTDRINRNRRDVFSYLMRSMVEADQRQPDKARADLNEAIKVDPKDAAARVARGSFYLSTGNLAQALADFNIAIRLDPKNASALSRPGSLPS